MNLIWQVLRMGNNKLKDIDLILTISNKYKKDIEKIFKNIINILKNEKILIDTINQGKERIMGLFKLPNICKKYKPHLVRHIDIRIIIKEILPWYLLYFGSGVSFSKNIRRIASKKGYKLSENGLYYRDTNKKVNFNPKTEKEIFNFLEIEYIKPKNR